MSLLAGETTASALDRELVEMGPANSPGATWVVILLGARNPYDGEGGLRVVTADTAEEAVKAAHVHPPSTLAVRYAWVHRLAEPYQPTLIPADIPTPEWGRPRPAR